MSQASARFRAERINIHIINTLAMRRARIGQGYGDRAAAGAARSVVDLSQICETIPSKMHNGKPTAPMVIEVTEPGMRTARRRIPSVLQAMEECDERRIAADQYSIAVEKVGAIGKSSAEGEQVDGGHGANDGGVTARMQHATTIRTVEAILIQEGLALKPHLKAPGNRRSISAIELMHAICVEGIDMRAILRRAGWSGQSRAAALLNKCAVHLLSLMADELGLTSTRPLPLHPFS